MKELSGDISLSRKEQLWYLLYNFVRGVWGSCAIIHSQFFYAHRFDNTDDSLGRKYIDAFLREKLSEFITPGKINVLDIGCGTGYLREILEELGYSGVYTGLDIVKEPDFDMYEGLAFKTQFIQQPIEAFEKVGAFDLVISNTALEHIANDSLAVHKAHQALAYTGVEIHIVPAFWSLFLYLWHGYRQYTRRRLKKLFGNTAIIYRLGGAFSFNTQFLLSTVPERLTGRKIFRRRGWYPRIADWCRRMDPYFQFCSPTYVIIRHHESSTEKN